MCEFAGQQSVFFRLHRERDIEKTVGHDVEPDDLRREDRQGIPEHECTGDDKDFAEARGEEVQDDFLYRLVYVPSLLNGRNDASEIIIEEHDVRCLFGHLRAYLPHRDADVGGDQGRCVVDTVARHGHYLSAFFVRIYDAQFVFGGYPREDRNAGKFPGQFGILHCIHFRARKHGVPFVPDTRRLGDGACGEFVIACYHHHFYSRRSGALHRTRDLRSQHILHTEKAHESEPVQRIRREVRGSILAHRARDDAQSPPGHMGEHRLKFFDVFFSQRVMLPSAAYLRAQRKHRFGRAFNNEKIPPVRLVDRCVILAFVVEGYFRY